MQFTVIGSGDAFGSGGRMQTCFHVSREGGDVLIDCGATALIGLQRLGLDPNRVAQIFITHLHGDHFSGLVWWLLHADYVSGRREPLTIIGPPGLEERFGIASEAMFPKAKARNRQYEVIFEVIEPGSVRTFADITVEAVEVVHPCGAPPLALRLVVDGKALAFSGDTEWVPQLLDISRDADLFVCECYSFEERVPSHTSWTEISRSLPEISARKILLTHMNDVMLAAVEAGSVKADRVVIGEDGQSFEV